MTSQERAKIERQMRVCEVVMFVCLWGIGITSLFNIVLAVVILVTQ